MSRTCIEFAIKSLGASRRRFEKSAPDATSPDRSPSLIVTRLAIPRSPDSDRRVFISVIAHDERREKKGNVDRTTRLQIYRLRGCVPNRRGSSWLPLHGDCTYRLGEETAAYCLLRFRGTPGNPKEATVMAESSTG